VIPYGQKSRSQTELPEKFVMGSGLLERSAVRAEFVRSEPDPSDRPAASLAIVWIPGPMAVMLLSGARPAYAAIYQFRGGDDFCLLGVSTVMGRTRRAAWRLRRNQRGLMLSILWNRSFHAMKIQVEIFFGSHPLMEDMEWIAGK
jgi:hypothetical protein